MKPSFKINFLSFLPVSAAEVFSMQNTVCSRYIMEYVDLLKNMRYNDNNYFWA